MRTTVGRHPRRGNWTFVQHPRARRVASGAHPREAAAERPGGRTPQVPAAPSSGVEDGLDAEPALSPHFAVDANFFWHSPMGSVYETNGVQSSAAGDEALADR